MGKTGVTFSFDDYPAIAIFASEASRALAQDGVENYLSIELHDNDGNAFELRVQKLDGQKPAQLVTALRARVARLEGALKTISTLYWHDAPAPEEMREIARRALEEK